MKKKLVSLLMVTTMAAAMFAGCGDKAPATDDANEPAATTDEVEPAAEEGKVLNIYCWNEEFQSRVKSHYPGYVEVDATHGTIGDVQVVWNITPSADNAYQNNLDTNLLAQADAAADDKIDIFLVEADYALKYVDTDYTMSVSDLGITDADTANMYKYTKDVMTDSNGVLKGLSWQACPGIMFYNRAAAIEVLGTDDPATVQEAVKDWDTWMATAEKFVAKGYQMCSSVNDTYRVYSNNVTSKWVVDGQVNIDANINKWVEDSKKLYEMKGAGTHTLWSDDWSKGFYPEGKVFCYFGPAWLINFCMGAGNEGAIATDGGWAGTVGPQGFYWGGTWICGATGTDNPTLVADIMRTLTCDKDTLVDIVKQDDDFANNSLAMEEMAATDYTSAVMGGQNPLPMYIEGVKTIDLSNITKYDQQCTEEFQNNMKQYIEGTASYEQALELFYTGVKEKSPELVTP